MATRAGWYQASTWRSTNDMTSATAGSSPRTGRSSTPPSTTVRAGRTGPRLGLGEREGVDRHAVVHDDGGQQGEQPLVDLPAAQRGAGLGRQVEPRVVGERRAGGHEVDGERVGLGRVAAGAADLDLVVAGAEHRHRRGRVRERRRAPGAFVAGPPSRSPAATTT